MVFKPVQTAVCAAEAYNVRSECGKGVCARGGFRKVYALYIVLQHKGAHAVGCVFIHVFLYGPVFIFGFFGFRIYEIVFYTEYFGKPPCYELAKLIIEVAVLVLHRGWVYENSFCSIVRGEHHAVSVGYSPAGGRNSCFVHHLLYNFSAVFIVAYYLQKYKSAHKPAGEQYAHGKYEHRACAYRAPRLAENRFGFF